MTVANQVGEALSLGRIERATMAHIRKWLPTYLREAERLEEVQADGVTALEVGSLPLPRSWRPAEGRLDKWPAEQLPAIIFGSPGLGDPPRRTGRGDHEGEWVLSATAVVSGNDDVTTRHLVGIYGVALRLLFAKQPLIEGLPVESIKYADEAYDGLPFSRSGSLMAGTVVFELGLSGLVTSGPGPLEPLEDPLDDPGPWPDVQTYDLTVDRSAPE